MRHKPTHIYLHPNSTRSHFNNFVWEEWNFTLHKIIIIRPSYQTLEIRNGIFIIGNNLKNMNDILYKTLVNHA